MEDKDNPYVRYLEGKTPEWVRVERVAPVVNTVLVLEEVVEMLKAGEPRYRVIAVVREMIDVIRKGN